MLPSVLLSLCSHLHSRDEEMEAQKDRVTYPGSHRAQLQVYWSEVSHVNGVDLFVILEFQLWELVSVGNFSYLFFFSKH